MGQTVLILGSSGKIGSWAADVFWNAGWTVRRYNRKAGDKVTAARGVDVIVNGLNPPAYHDWERTIPDITAQVILAAKANGATVILPGNIYNFGDRPGILDENTQQTPHTKKGRVRVEMEETYRASGVQTIVLRAGNFIDPNGNADIMNMLIMRNARKGKITAPADPDTMQAYAYVPDWARAALQLAERRHDLAPFEDIPFPGHTFSITELHRHLTDLTQQPFTIDRFPWWLMSLLGPFWELARELREMRYLYAMPHQIDAVKFDRLLPDFVPTDRDTVMRAGLPVDVYPNQVMRTSRGSALAQ